MNVKDKLQVIGVTGTNGKTSICYYIAKLLQHFQQQCGIIGTLGIGVLPNLEPMINTTPANTIIQQFFTSMITQNIAYVAMEVSSHGLVQQRIANIDFHTVVFTNLTQDHLDYHHNMANYWQAKLQLFLQYKFTNAVINLDSPFGRQLLTLLPETTNIVGYTIDEQRKMLVPYLYPQPNMQIISASDIDVPLLLGDFNISNALAATAVCMLLGFKLSKLKPVLLTLAPAPGRMQIVNVAPKIIVDYAHTPDALEQVLTELRAHCLGKLWCIFGCGGDRDKTKRPVMLQIALAASDYVILTQDNSRNEEPEQIIADILQHRESPNNVKIELDRALAIEQAIINADKNDIILIAGKGHETYQDCGGKRVYFSDIKAAETAVNLRNCKNLIINIVNE